MLNFYLILVLTWAADIIKFFNNHHRARALFDEGRKTDAKVNRLTVAVSTRWYSQYTSLKSVYVARHVLRSICEEKGQELNEISDKGPGIIVKVGSVSFWTKLAALIKLIEYPVNIIGKIRLQNEVLTL